MVSNHSTTFLLQRAAHDINKQLEHEDIRARSVDDETTRALARQQTTTKENWASAYPAEIDERRTDEPVSGGATALLDDYEELRTAETKVCSA
ncbi:hypothetical protein F443_20373 [Phytophthora nicotianae P1569]|uniref:Uncharacterized protein n=2 Tax=Phytophthora nicotianae TaxID=4792 RepID=V9E2Z8_PHYNI|nr:hypothetical protein F443_20373 [Phytophthora nicotianae P1569]ETO61644.1 hypothetical protein F444_20377 [Phytophthora nicotianae P1976]